ncbi:MULTISPECIES: hypothetical protein [Pseudomonas]|uniref:Uncharacterized protein n=1 Tax=Pseudomonas hunanensis TaxID=1247546 RepID=A0ACC6K9W7_9PSED|nr:MULTISPECIES: hypothetical protein [Pseudomonas]MBP2263377.1 hypothetical protein [Pseudomonas sp. BP8]MDR6715219.1 hypothetical protein [Pseudomonas hunanensis]HDS1735865.1 hypothetical protein [Pseudomonas putida]
MPGLDFLHTSLAVQCLYGFFRGRSCVRQVPLAHVQPHGSVRIDEAAQIIQ